MHKIEPRPTGRGFLFKPDEAYIHGNKEFKNYFKLLRVVKSNFRLDLIAYLKKAIMKTVNLIY